MSIEHLKDNEPRPHALLATNIVTREATAKKAHANVYKDFNRIIMIYASEDEKRGKVKDHSSIIPLTSMIIGTVAIASTVVDETLAKDILDTCRKQTKKILND